MVSDFTIWEGNRLTKGRKTIPRRGFEIRLESVGGLGAHLAGQILAEAGVLLQGLNGSHFSSYGSEKKGTPVRSFVRFYPADRELRTSEPVIHPDLVAIFHESLLRTEPVLAGLSPADGSTVIVNTPLGADEMRLRLGWPGPLAVLDATGIAVEEGSRVNTAMLGAVVRFLPFLEAEAVRTAIRSTFRRKYAHLVEANLRTFDRGFRELQVSPGGAAPEPPPHRVAEGSRPRWGYLNAPMGGLILDPANSVLRDQSGFRTGFLPVYDRESCVDCGLCDLTCPDYCIVWEDDPSGERLPVAGGQVRRRMVGIDYQYCKGCLRCVAVCPTGSLRKEREVEGYAEAHRVPRYRLGVASGAGRPVAVAP